MFLFGLLILRRTLQSCVHAAAVPYDLIYPDDLALEGVDCLVSMLCPHVNKPDVFLDLRMLEKDAHCSRYAIS